jgi:hypothetical protein
VVQVHGLCADLGGVQPERMQFDVCSMDDDADSAVLFLCDDRDRVALAFCMNGGGNMGIEDNVVDHNQVTAAQSISIKLSRSLGSGSWSRMRPASGSAYVLTFTGMDANHKSKRCNLCAQRPVSAAGASSHPAQVQRVSRFFRERRSGCRKRTV